MHVGQCSHEQRYDFLKKELLLYLITIDLITYSLIGADRISREILAVFVLFQGKEYHL